MRDIYQNSNDAVLYGISLQFFVQKFNSIQFEIRRHTSKLFYWVYEKHLRTDFDLFLGYHEKL